MPFGLRHMRQEDYLVRSLYQQKYHVSRVLMEFGLGPRYGEVRACPSRFAMIPLKRSADYARSGSISRTRPGRSSRVSGSSCPEPLWDFFLLDIA